jgi:flagellar export protein FliJ
MADLKPLIRVRRHVVEQKQKLLSDLYRQAEALENEKKELEEEFVQERDKVKTMDVQMLSYFGPYAKAIKNRVRKIGEGISRLETRIQIAREDMREAFADLKKIQITQRRREDSFRAQINKKESQELDDIGIETHRRKQD